MQSARRAPTPNSTLRTLLSEAGWTQEAFAGAIRRVAGEAGVQLRYDRASVAHWLRGSRPRPAVQGFMAEALSRRLARPVTLPELGMDCTGGPGRPAGGQAPSGPRPLVEDVPAGVPGRPLDTLTSLTQAVVGPPRVHGPTVPYETVASSRTVGDDRTPGTSDHLPPPVGHAGRGTANLSGTPGPTPRGGAVAPYPLDAVGDTSYATADAASVRAHADFFTEQADRHGGGHIRAPLAAYLAALARTLRASGGNTRSVRGGRAGWTARVVQYDQLLTGASRLSYLLARVYVDEQRHGLAQRAFRTAGELAEDAGVPAEAAFARRALSTQAHQLGHRRDGLWLAEAACDIAPPDTEPSARSFLYAGLAVAAADAGRRTDALGALRQAEHAMAHADALGGGPIGGYQEAALQYQTGRVRACLGDREGAIAELRASLRSRAPEERRARALSHAELAELLLQEGRLEEACAAWEAFLRDCALVRSGRARRARARIPALLRPYARQECVQTLLARSGGQSRGHGTQ